MNTDILIIGGGLSAYCAAYEIIKESNLQVTLLQWGGGASPYIHGFCLPIGADDSEKLFFSDSMESGYHQSDETLVARLCKDSLTLPDYFRELGVDIDRNGQAPRLIKSLGSSAARIAGIGNNTGPVMLNTLHKLLSDSGRFQEHRDLRALALVKKDGAVVGARCYNKTTDRFQTVSAGLVILATGGFGRLFPESTNSPDIGGDGCAMAFHAGCSLTDMEFIQFEPSAAVWPEALIGKSIITTMFYEGAVLRSGDGNRFMNEQVSKDLQSKAIAAQIRKGNATPHGGVWFDATAVPDAMWDGIYKPYLNRYLAQGIDMRKEPVEIAPAAHTTCGGVCIDENCRTEIPGLIACGEVTGGLHGANRLGGNAGLETMVFGRIAGQTAVRQWKKQDPVSENETPNRQQDTAGQRSQLERILRTCLGVIRTGQELADGIGQIDALLLKTQNYENCYQLYRLHNDLITARIALMSALERKGSCGCHCRADDEKEAQPYRIIVQNNQGSFALSKNRLKVVNMQKVIVEKKRYVDSVSLMGIPDRVKTLKGITNVEAMMATAANQAVLKLLEYTLPEDVTANDLVIAVTADSAETCDAAVEMVKNIIDRKDVADYTHYNNLEELEAAGEQYDLCQISLPGEYAACEAKKALHMGMDLFIFSDNVSIEEELELKQLGASLGKLVMGPDAGVAVLNGVALAAGSILKDGPIGIVAASGSGAQEVGCIIEKCGFGVSNLIGTGGRDLYPQIGGITMLEGIRRMEKDPKTKVIVLVSKLADLGVMDKVLCFADTCTKPVVAVFLGSDATLFEGHKVHGTFSLEECALKAVELAGGNVGDFGMTDEQIEQLAQTSVSKLEQNKKYFRGLYCGGTFTEEALQYFAAHNKDVTLYSNLSNRYCTKLADSEQSEGHAILDLGAEDFTAKAPHPVFDPGLRLCRLRKELDDPQVGVVLLDFITGPGVAADPITAFATECAKHPEIVFISTICGSEEDPQNVKEKEILLKNAGVIVVKSNYQSAKLASAMMNALERR